MKCSAYSKMYFLNNYLEFGNYKHKDFDVSENDKDNNTIWVINKDNNNLKPYTYEEAINLTGHGRYSIGLLAVNCLALLAMSLDMFGFPVVVSGSACDLQLSLAEQNFLLSIPFIGTILFAYFWGYISDTRGRKSTLQLTMWVSFVASLLTPLSPNWIVMAVLKFISISFCSCAQSVTYTMLGESCAENVKGLYFFFITSLLYFAFPTYITLSYISLNLEFSIDLYFINFTPWRLLALALALPLGVTAVCLHYFHESPKFLANILKEKEALQILEQIWKKNRCLGARYPVQKLILNEEGNTSKKTSLLRSLWDQTAPLFRMPLLLRTIQLFYITFVIYSTTNSILIWFPYMTDAFMTGMSSSKGGTVSGMCDIIDQSHTNVTMVEPSCEPKSDAVVVWCSIGQGMLLFLINMSICKLASRRRLLMMLFLLASSICAAGAAASDVVGLSVAFYYMIPVSMTASGFVFSYFVDLYPTSYRGMASCLGVLVSRMSGLFSINVIGIYILSECSTTFYMIAANLMCGVIVAFFLPQDNNVKKM